MAAKTTPTAGVPGVLEQYGRSQALAPGAANKAANGPKDLEQSLGEAKWNSLLGETTKAQQEANALGSESGVQGLLQQGQSSPEQNTAFDAALINGQGGPQFRDLAQKYGGNQLEQGVVNADQKAQDAWKQLQGDVDARAAWDASAQKAPSAAGTVSQLAPVGATMAAAPTDPNAANDGFDLATQKYGEERSKSGGNPTYSEGSNNTGYGNTGWGFFSSPSGGMGSTETINVGGLPGKNGGYDWNSWFGGADTGGKSPEDMGLTSAEIWSLSLMTPADRAAWLTKHNKKG
jgi:hypothetical protein